MTDQEFSSEVIWNFTALRETTNNSSNAKLEDILGIGMEKVEADFSLEYNRIPLLELDQHINSFWEKKKCENPSLYNASKFRLKSVKSTERSGNNADEDGVLLQIGMTDYKDFVCTNSNQDILSQLLHKGSVLFSDRHACASDAIGNCAVVMTGDNFVLFVRRSFTVFEAQGMTDFPGGHSEPEEMLKKCKLKPDELNQVKGKDVVFEIFHSVIREVRDEINLPEESLTWPVLMCVMRNESVGWKPHLSFFVSCSLGKEKVLELYSVGGPEADESSEIIFVHIDDLLRTNISELQKRFGKMSACGLKTLEVFLEKYKYFTQ